jgi:hypothetical protein
MTTFGGGGTKRAARRRPDGPLLPGTGGWLRVNFENERGRISFVVVVGSQPERRGPGIVSLIVTTQSLRRKKSFVRARMLKIGLIRARRI